MSSRIQLRRGTAAAWTAANPVLAAVEPGFETDTGLEKRGDGATAWTSLPYFNPPATVLLDNYYDAPIYANKSAAIQAAYVAAAAQRATLELQALRIYSLDTATLKLNPATPIKIRGNKATLQANWGKPRCIDFVRTADYQTFNDIEIEDLSCDANSLTASANQSVIGNVIDGSGNQRIHASRVTLRRVKVKNLPVSGTGKYLGFALVSSHLASNEGTQNTITDVVLEDCRVDGGDTGYFVAGSGSATAGLGVNVFMDRIELTRCVWDRGIVPSATGSGAGIQLGSLGFGGSCAIRDCHMSNSSDVGYEIDSFQSAICDGCEAVDCFTSGYLYRNFRAPIALQSQVNVWRSCTSRSVNLDPSATSASAGYNIIGDSSTAGFIFGEAVLDNCQQTCQTAFASPSSAGYAVSASGAQFRKLTVRNLAIGFSSLAMTGTSLSVQLLRVQSLLPGAVYDIDGVTVRMDGTRTTNTGPTSNWRPIALDGTDFEFDVRRVSVDMANFANIAAGTTSDTFFWVDVGQLSASTARGTVDGVRFVSAPTGGSHNVINQGNSLTLGGKLYIYHLDAARLPASGSDVAFLAAAKTSTIVQDSISLRTAFAPVGLTGLVTATGKTLATGWNANAHFTQGSGTSITAIDYSTNGGTTYTNFLTQASGALPAGFDQVIPNLGPDALIKVTFTGTQPTVTLVPVNS